MLIIKKLQITLHPQPRHQLFRNEPPIFDDLKACLNNWLYFLLKMINILALAAPQLRKYGNIPKVIGVGMGGARWAIAHPLLKVGGPAIGFGPPTFRRGPFPKFGPVFFATGLRD